MMVKCCVCGLVYKKIKYCKTDKFYCSKECMDDDNGK